MGSVFFLKTYAKFNYTLKIILGQGSRLYQAFDLQRPVSYLAMEHWEEGLKPKIPVWER